MQRLSETIAFPVTASDVFWKGLSDFCTTIIDHSVSQLDRLVGAAILEVRGHKTGRLVYAITSRR